MHIRFGEEVLLRVYNVYMIRKGEVLNLKVVGGTGDIEKEIHFILFQQESWMSG